jgi:hypothetical protein
LKKKLPGSGPYAVFTVKLTLLDTKPPIWRRLRRPAGTALADMYWLHQTMTALWLASSRFAASVLMPLK